MHGGSSSFDHTQDTSLFREFEVLSQFRPKVQNVAALCFDFLELLNFLRLKFEIQNFLPPKKKLLSAPIEEDDQKSIYLAIEELLGKF